MTAAEKVIKKLGGAANVAAELSEIMGKSINESTVFRWTYERPRGTGGDIPTKYHDYLLDVADKQGARLAKKSLFNI